MAHKVYTDNLTVLDAATMNDVDGLVYQGTIPTTATAVPFIRKNLLINGTMQVWQRGTSFPAIANNGYGPDRWRATYSTTTVNITQQARPSNSVVKGQFITRVENSSGSGTWAINQSLERTLVEQLKGRTVLFSCYLRAGAALAGNLSITAGTTTTEGGVTTNQATATTTIPNASVNVTTFTRFSVAVTVLGNNTDQGFVVTVAAASAVGGANNYFEVADCQLEIVQSSSNQPTDVDVTPFEVDLVACQRFFQKSFSYGVAPATGVGNAGAEFSLAQGAGAAVNLLARTHFFVPMRTTPTVTLYNPAAANNQVRNSTRTNDGASSANEGTSINEKGFAVATTGQAGWAIADLLLFHWSANAEF